MNKLILRFYLINKRQVVEVIFDSRLSFMENFKLLNELLPIELDNGSYIIDPYRTIALRKDVALEEFNFKNFMTLYIY